MSNFLVLGLVPGTNFQVTFSMWLLATMLVVVLVAVRLLRKQIIGWRIALAVFLATRSYAA